MALETWINRWLIYPLATHLEFSFVGLDAQTETARIDAISKKVKSYMTVNEARAAFDLEPLDNPIADYILDSSFINAAQMAEQQSEEDPDQDQEEIDQDQEPDDLDEDQDSFEAEF